MKKLKMKTHKSTAKRFRVTAKGKIVRKKMGHRHNAHLKNKSKAGRSLIQDRFVMDSKADVKKIKALMGV
jgi:large subunit ribosomal protein L35